LAVYSLLWHPGLAQAGDQALSVGGEPCPVTVDDHGIALNSAPQLKFG